MTIDAEQIFEKAHTISAHGLKILVATGPYHPTAASELDLAASDDWWLHRASLSHRVGREIPTHDIRHRRKYLAPDRHQPGL